MENWNGSSASMGSSRPADRLGFGAVSRLMEPHWSCATPAFRKSTRWTGKPTKGSQPQAKQGMLRRIRVILLQLCVFGFGLQQDRDVWVGVFPEAKEIIVSGARLCSISSERIRARKSQMRK